MKNIISIFALLVLSLELNAFEIKRKFSTQMTGEFEKFLEISCTAKDKNFCNQLCANDLICKVPEVLCEDCITESSQLMHSVFVDDVNLTYKADIMFIENNQLLGFLKNRKFMSMPYDFFLNKFSFNRKEILKKEFEKLCYINIESATLILTVDDKNAASQIVGVICKDSEGSVVLPINLNPEFTKQQTDFWQILNVEIGYQIAPLKLKMSTELGIAIKEIAKESVKDSAATIEISIEEPAQELIKPTACRVKQFSDGTGFADNDYYHQCIKPKIVRKKKNSRRK